MSLTSTVAYIVVKYVSVLETSDTTFCVLTKLWSENFNVMDFALTFDMGMS
jgi:hypothetical protein